MREVRQSEKVRDEESERLKNWKLVKLASSGTEI
jgi:hypothetical protein